ncbi:MAG: hypothetical protein ABI564_04220 [Ideonella sp.]
MNTSPTQTTNLNPNGNGHVAERVADTVADVAQNTAARTTRIANDTFDHLSSAVETARGATVPALERLGSSAESLARRSAETARQKSQQLREQAQHRSEQAVGYIRDEPFKSVLLAAAVGALFGLLLSFSRRER